MAKNVAMGIILYGVIGAAVVGVIGLLVGGGSGGFIGAVVGAALGALFGIFAGVVVKRREEVAKRTGLPYETVRRMHNDAVKKTFDDARRGR